MSYFRNQVERVAGIEPHHVGFNLHMRMSRAIAASARPPCAGDVVTAKNHLPLQIRQRHGIVIDHTDVAYTGGGEIKQYRAPVAGAITSTRAPDLAWPGPPTSRNTMWARITFEFLGVQHDVNSMESRAFRPAS